MIRTSVPIPVVWFNVNPEGSTRGYWDQAMLQEIFDGTEATIAAEYQQFDGFADWIDAGRPTEGAIVVIQGQSNARFAAEAKRLIKFARLSWMLLIITSDEQREFPTEEFLFCAERTSLWQQTPQEGDKDDAAIDEYIPFGYATGMRDILRELGPQVHSLRPADFVLFGQNTHPRRRECFDALADVNSLVLPTLGFGQGVTRWQYLHAMEDGRVAPCPAGNVSVDSFRAAEAFEAGCTPLLDAVNRRGELRSYWGDVLGPWTKPYVVEGSWKDALTRPGILTQSTANAAQEAWQRYKRETIQLLAQSAANLSRAAVVGPVTDQVTVIIPTSPIPSHPDPIITIRTINSIRERLPLARIVVLADGVRPEQEDRRQDYEEYLAQLLWHANFLLKNVEVRISPEWRHQALLVRDFLDSESWFPDAVLLFVEHDTPLVGEIPFERLINHAAANRTIRFYFDDELHPAHEAMTYHTYQLNYQDGKGHAKMIETHQWSQRPHLSPVSYYRRILHEFFPDDCRTMIEDRMHGVVNEWAEKVIKHGLEVEFNHWISIYAPEGSIKRSTHLDGRCTDPKGLGVDPKFEMNYGTRS